ncbi:MAG TPA: hypothetical protein VM238_05020 [Phycisphaerae bacterium]|nr:hypothetical protein [Phycisphaerae bacterium]
MTRQPCTTDPADSDGTIIVVCRDPARRAAVERALRPTRTYRAAMDALLAVARKAPRAVLLNLQDVSGSARDVLAALRRCRPDVPIAILVAPEDEPLGRRLVADGAADCFVLPNEVARLPALLEPETEAAAPASALTVEDRRASRLFRAACDLAELAGSQPQPLLRDGAMLIFRALGARQGHVFACGAAGGGPEPVAAFGEADLDNLTGLEAERTAAERTLRTREVLLIAAGTAGAPPDGLICVPVCLGDSTFGMLCLSGKTDGTPLDAGDRDAAAALADVLAHLYRSALLRTESAQQALRDPKTGLLKADPFLTHLETRLAQAEALHTEVGLVLLEPRPGVSPQQADVLERLGAGIRAALANGWEGGRLDAGLYAVSLSRSADDAPRDAAGGDLYGAAATRLAEAGRQVDAGRRLRTGLAVFPRDGATAGSLVEAAKGRLTASV